MKEELHTPKAEAGCYHVPVLRERSVELLVTDPDGIYIDATFGGGGHTRCILEQLSAQGHLYGFDQDPAVMGLLLTALNRRGAAP